MCTIATCGWAYTGVRDYDETCLIYRCISEWFARSPSHGLICFLSPMHKKHPKFLFKKSRGQCWNSCTGYPRHRENRENGQKKSLSGKTQGIWKFCQNSGNFVCSSCKLPDSKGKGYCDICLENFHFFPRSWIGLPSQFRLCNSNKVCKLVQGKIVIGQGKHREFENTI